MRLSRRALLAAAAASGALWQWGPRQPFAWQLGKRRIEGSIVGPNVAQGHRLRSGGLPRHSEEIRLPVAIVGGGISGLSAAWKLERAGLVDYRLFELEGQLGGTSRSDTGPSGPYPWGAHYVPVPGPEATAVRELFTELGVLQIEKGHPVCNERYLCFAPQERLFIHGRWQEGLYPSSGASGEELAELGAFRARMAQFQNRRDARGRPAFALPMEKSARDPDLLALDRVSMGEWLLANGFKSRRLRWYVDYACRDDYGCTVDQTSAWAGIFYYASRQPPEGAGDEGQVLTWPAGNGWIVDQLKARLSGRLVPGMMACRIDASGPGVAIDLLESKTGKMIRVLCDQVIAAVPKFILSHLLTEGGPAREDLQTFTYSPWVVANVRVSKLPEGRGAPPSWDNVFYESDSLGYITATHQQLKAGGGPSTLTWYLPLCREAPPIARAKMLASRWEDWCDLLQADLVRGHPGIENSIERIDVMLWAHGMVRPQPGFVWGAARQRVSDWNGPLTLAHSDLSGLPLFEEAQYRGVLAAERVLIARGVPFLSSLG